MPHSNMLYSVVLRPQISLKKVEKHGPFSSKHIHTCIKRCLKCLQVHISLSKLELLNSNWCLLHTVYNRPPAFLPCSERCSLHSLFTLLNPHCHTHPNKRPGLTTSLLNSHSRPHDTVYNSAFSTSWQLDRKSLKV